MEVPSADGSTDPSAFSPRKFLTALAREEALDHARGYGGGGARLWAPVACVIIREVLGR